MGETSQEAAMRTHDHQTTGFTVLFILVGLLALFFLIGVVALRKQPQKEQSYFDFPPERISYTAYLGCRPTRSDPQAIPTNPCKHV